VRSITAVREHLQAISEKLDRLPRVDRGDGVWSPSVDAVHYGHIYDLEQAASHLDTVTAIIDMIPHMRGESDE